MSGLDKNSLVDGKSLEQIIELAEKGDAGVARRMLIQVEQIRDDVKREMDGLPSNARFRKLPLQEALESYNAAIQKIGGILEQKQKASAAQDDDVDFIVEKAEDNKLGKDSIPVEERNRIAARLRREERKARKDAAAKQEPHRAEAAEPVQQKIEQPKAEAKAPELAKPSFFDRVVDFFKGLVSKITNYFSAPDKLPVVEKPVADAPVYEKQEPVVQVNKPEQKQEDKVQNDPKLAAVEQKLDQAKNKFSVKLQEVATKGVPDQASMEQRAAENVGRYKDAFKPAIKVEAKVPSDKPSVSAPVKEAPKPDMKAVVERSNKGPVITPSLNKESEKKDSEHQSKKLESLVEKSRRLKDEAKARLDDTKKLK